MVVDGVVVDANIMSKFYHQLLLEEGDLYELITTIIHCYGIALSDKIEQEWKNTVRTQFFNDWFDEALKNGRLRYVENPRLEKRYLKRIHNVYGLPKKKGRDIEYIKVAYMTILKYILTEDIHFYDPKKKHASQKEKKKVKNKRQGALCRYLKKALGITVGLPEHCYDDLPELST